MCEGSRQLTSNERAEIRVFVRDSNLKKYYVKNRLMHRKWAESICQQPFEREGRRYYFTPPEVVQVLAQWICLLDGELIELISARAPGESAGPAREAICRLLAKNAVDSVPVLP
jgi:hypothetical protein